MTNLFTYDANTGNLTWKVRERSAFRTDAQCTAWNRRYAGRIAGTASKGRHVRTSIEGKPCLAHRIIWEMHHGSIPDGMEVDHIDGCYTNNRIQNLRLATPSQNRCNAGRRAHNTTGIKGVFWDKVRGKWASYIGIGGTQINLGRYPTKGLAAVAYAKAAIRYHGRFARLGERANSVSLAS